MRDRAFADGRAVRGEHHNRAVEERLCRAHDGLCAVSQGDAREASLELDGAAQHAPFGFGHVVRPDSNDADERGRLGHDEQRKVELDTRSGDSIRHGVVADTDAEAERTDAVRREPLHERAALVARCRKSLPCGEHEFTTAELGRGVEQFDAVHPGEFGVGVAVHQAKTQIVPPEEGTQREPH